MRTVGEPFCDQASPLDEKTKTSTEIIAIKNFIAPSSFLRRCSGNPSELSSERDLPRLALSTPSFLCYRRANPIRINPGNRKEKCHAASREKRRCSTAKRSSDRRRRRRFDDFGQGLRQRVQSHDRDASAGMSHDAACSRIRAAQLRPGRRNLVFRRGPGLSLQERRFPENSGEQNPL